MQLYYLITILARQNCDSANALQKHAQPVPLQSP